MTDNNTSDAAPEANGNKGDLFNTAAGWVLFAAGLGLGLSILAGKYFHTEPAKEPGYLIQVAEATGGEDAGPSLAVLLADATVEKGAAVFAKCQACHNVEQGGANGIGPNLYGVMGQPIGQHAAGFGYSSALSGHGGEWTWENMDAWLTSPRGFASGTSMSFAGLSKPEDRAALMVYLEANGGAPARPVAEAAPAEDAATAEGATEEAATEEAAAE